MLKTTVLFQPSFHEIFTGETEFCLLRGYWRTAGQTSGRRRMRTLPDIPCCTEQTSRWEPGRAIRRPPQGPPETSPPSSAAVDRTGSHTRWTEVAADSLGALQTSREATDWIREKFINSFLVFYCFVRGSRRKTLLEIRTNVTHLVDRHQARRQEVPIYIIQIWRVQFIKLFLYDWWAFFESIEKFLKFNIIKWFINTLHKDSYCFFHLERVI